MIDKDQYKSLFKIIIIGNSNTGKSCLLHQFIENKFKRNSNHTIGVEFGSKIIQYGDENIKLQIWDTAGQERFKSVARTYYRGSLGALIVYDITNQDSYYALEQWIKDVRDLARQDISIVIIGNKSDLSDLRAIDKIDANKFCQDQNVQFLEVSALANENVEQSFNLLVKNIMIKIQNGQYIQNDYLPPNYQNREIIQQKKQSQCCYGQK